MAKRTGSLGTVLLKKELQRREMKQTALADALSDVLGEKVRQSYVWSLLQGAEPGIVRAMALKRILRIPLTSWTEPRP